MTKRSSPSGVEAMRAAFDGAFAIAPVRDAAQWTDYLAVEIGGVVHAIRIGDVAGLHRCRRITPLPSPSPSLLGLAGFRGAAVPVHGLGRLLGCGADDRVEWFVLVGRDEPVALAFDSFQGHFRIDRGQVPAIDDQVRGRHVNGVAQFGTRRVPIADIASILDAIRVGAGRQPGEKGAR